MSWLIVTYLVIGWTTFELVVRVASIESIKATKIWQGWATVLLWPLFWLVIVLTALWKTND